MNYYLYLCLLLFITATLSRLGGRPLSLSALGAAIYLRNELEETGYTSAGAPDTPPRTGSSLGNIIGNLMESSDNSMSTGRRDEEKGRDGMDSEKGRGEGGREGGREGRGEGAKGQDSARSTVGDRDLDSRADSRSDSRQESKTPRGQWQGQGQGQGHTQGVHGQQTQGQTQGQGQGQSLNSILELRQGGVIPAPLALTARRKSSRGSVPTSASGKKGRDEEEFHPQVTSCYLENVVPLSLLFPFSLSPLQ